MKKDEKYEIYVTKSDDRIYVNLEELNNSFPYEKHLIENEVLQKVCCRPMCYVWTWNNGEPKLLYSPTDEEKLAEKKNKLNDFKSYLNDTDYVVSKLNELKLEDDDEYEKAKAEYSEVLAKRKEARKRINELESEISDSSSSSDTVKSTI